MMNGDIVVKSISDAFVGREERNLRKSLMTTKIKAEQ
jgi:hypothetical protein